MTLLRTLHVVQVSFPQVYLACHTRHQRKRTTVLRLSSSDSSLLAHLDERVAIQPSRLAAHLGIARSTVSESLKRLAGLGYVSNATASESSSSARMTAVVLTPKGAAAIQSTSVLETGRLRAALEGLPAKDQRAIAKGMELLAGACRRLGKPKRNEREY